MRFSNHFVDLTEVEFWFVKHVYPYANLDRRVTFGDFEDLKTKAINSLYEFSKKNGVVIDGIKSYKQISLFDDSNTTKNSVSVIASMEDSSLFKILGDNRKFFPKELEFETITMRVPSVAELEKECVLQVVFPNKWDVNFAHLLLNIKEAGEKRKAKIILIFDQVGMYKDSLPNSNHLTLSQHLLFWKLCRQLCGLLAQSEIQIRHELSQPGFQANKHDHKDQWNAFRDSKKHLNKMRRLSKGLAFDMNLFATRYDDFIKIFSDASKDIEITDDFNSDEMYLKLLKLAQGGLALDFSDDELKVIENLAKSPMFGRPFYGLKYPSFSVYTDIPGIMPNNLQILAYVNFDDKLDWPTNIFVEWMMVNPNDKGRTHKDIYWID